MQLQHFASRETEAIAGFLYLVAFSLHGTPPAVAG